ncbi:hypothetical protein M426DRAFT_13786 [Hypoxylon sp. CI-4A]|nr:hypothetical protein M426DRAFT_13786 [Hypoxylon sp. CI-4A]
MTYRRIRGYASLSRGGQCNKRLPMDDDNSHLNTTSERRKRPRSRHDDTPLAACDQCRGRKVKCDKLQPECSNCRKAGVACTSSGARDDFSSVVDRLDDIDRTLSTLTQLTQEISARANIPPQIPTLYTSPDIQRSQTLSTSNYQALLPSTRQGRPRLAVEDSYSHVTVKVEQGGERVYPYPAALALMKSLSKHMTQIVERGGETNGNTDMMIRDPAVRSGLRQQLEGFPYPCCTQPVITTDRAPITTPPRFILDLSIDNYLRNFNTSTPIFDDASLRQVIDLHYSGRPSDDNNAWALIFNNIVLLELGMETQVSRASNSVARNMNDDLFPSFLRNCDRALADLDSFACPSLVNIQALLTLALVTWQFYSGVIYEKVCQRACQVGRTVGLHRSKTGAGGDPTERERLYRVLYTLDKYRVFMTGQPCDLHSFDSDVILKSSSEDESSIQRLNHAFDQMMEIWEEIYLALHSLRAVASDKSCRIRQGRRVAQLIDEWYEQNRELMETPLLNEGPEVSSRQLELKYCYHVTQVLILRHDRHNADVQQEVRSHARICLRLIREASSSQFTTTTLTLLHRIFNIYPIPAFIDIIAFHFDNLAASKDLDPEFEADSELLRIVSRHLQVLQNPNFPTVYLTRLQLGLNWALGIIDVVKARSVNQSQGSLGNTVNSSSTPGFASNLESAFSPVQPNSNICLDQQLSNENIESTPSGTELIDFGFCTNGPQSTSSDLNLGTQLYPTPQERDLGYNLADFFQGPFE